MLINRIIILLIILPGFSFGQDSALTFTEVVEIPGQSKEQLFIKTRQWLNEAIKSSKTALQIADKETGELFGKSYISSGYKWKSLGKVVTVPAEYSLEFSILVKDGKYKYIFTKFTTVDYNGNYEEPGLLTSADTVYKKLPYRRPAKLTEEWRNRKEGVAMTMKLLTDNLKDYMHKEAKSDF